MKTKRVLKYYCDYCKKSGGSKYHLAKHESHCTLNPKRDCGMCKVMGETPQPIEKLLEVLPNPSGYKREITHDFEQYGGLVSGEWEETVFEFPKELLLESLKNLRELTCNCPACILSAFRQKGIYLSLIPEFDYKKEVGMFWKENQPEPDHYYY